MRCWACQAGVREGVGGHTGEEREGVDFDLAQVDDWSAANPLGSGKGMPFNDVSDIALQRTIPRVQTQTMAPPSLNSVEDSLVGHDEPLRHISTRRKRDWRQYESYDSNQGTYGLLQFRSGHSF